MERRFWSDLFAVGVLAVCAPLGAAHADAVPVDAAASLVRASGAIAALEDTAGRARLEEIRHRDAEFVAVAGQAPNFGQTRSAIWLRYELESTGNSPQLLYLQLGNPEIADAALFVMAGGRLLRTEWTGANMPARSRPVANGGLALPFDLPARSRVVLYLRVTADGVPLIVPARVLDPAALQAARHREHWQNGALTGLFAALLAGGVLSWLLRRDALLPWYLLLLLTAWAGLTARNGFGPAYLYPALSWPQRQGVAVALGLAATLLLLFARGFLGAARLPRVDRLLRGLLWVGGALVVAGAAVPPSWSLPLELPLFFAIVLLCAWAGVRTWFAGWRAARFFLAAQAVIAAALLHYAAVRAGLLAWGAASDFDVSLGASAAALLLALALADRQALARRAAHDVDAAAHAALLTRCAELERLAEQRTTELEQARRHADYLATTDPLTGIFNRRGLLPLLMREVELAQRAHLPLTLIAFDIDYFKRINDEFGASEGDRLLQEVVTVARQVVRATDLFGRVAGEEFVVALRDTPVAAGRDVAERMRADIAARVHVGPQGHAITASFGVAGLSAALDTADALLRAATTGVDRAKNRGRNRVVLVEPELADAGLLQLARLPDGH
ncbi:MAG: diguanylate cyclase [Gammaproteobacteria bacterium]|nr:diguanylate cyclase [Gammaproteobacteria bacterium]